MILRSNNPPILALCRTVLSCLFLIAPKSLGQRLSFHKTQPNPKAAYFTGPRLLPPLPRAFELPNAFSEIRVLNVSIALRTER